MSRPAVKLVRLPLSLSVMVGLALLTVACSSSALGAPLVVRNYLDTLSGHGYACSGPSHESNGPGLQWICAKSASASIGLNIVVDSDGVGLRGLTGTITQQGNPDPSEALPFYRDLMDAQIGPPTTALWTWINSNVNSGGHTTVGDVVVNLDPLGPLSHLSLFVLANAQPT